MERIRRSHEEGMEGHLAVAADSIKAAADEAPPALAARLRRMWADLTSSFEVKSDSFEGGEHGAYETMKGNMLENRRSAQLRSFIRGVLDETNLKGRRR